jgi:hypothetical protein
MPWTDIQCWCPSLCNLGRYCLLLRQACALDQGHKMHLRLVVLLARVAVYSRSVRSLPSAILAMLSRFLLMLLLAPDQLHMWLLSLDQSETRPLSMRNEDIIPRYPNSWSTGTASHKLAQPEFVYSSHSIIVGRNVITAYQHEFSTC